MSKENKMFEKEIADLEKEHERYMEWSRPYSQSMREVEGKIAVYRHCQAEVEESVRRLKKESFEITKQKDGKKYIALPYDLIDKVFGGIGQ